MTKSEAGRISDEQDCHVLSIWTTTEKYSKETESSLRSMVSCTARQRKLKIHRWKREEDRLLLAIRSSFEEKRGRKGARKQEGMQEVIWRG